MSCSGRKMSTFWDQMGLRDWNQRLGYISMVVIPLARIAGSILGLTYQDGYRDARFYWWGLIALSLIVLGFVASVTIWSLWRTRP